jgi:AraC-like DNA-binding protein
MSIVQQVSEHLRACDIRRAARRAVAEHLGISETQLGRELAAEGKPFNELMREEQLHRVYCNLDMDGEELAELCGYTDRNSFYRAVRNWTGMGWTEFKEAAMSAQDQLQARQSLSIQVNSLGKARRAKFMERYNKGEPDATVETVVQGIPGFLLKQAFGVAYGK